MTNREIAKVLREIGEILEAKDKEFKPRAYQNAATTIQNLGEEVEEIYEKGGLENLEELQDIGSSIAKKVEELIETGECEYHQELKEELPIDMDAIVQIEGVGPKTALKLYQKLGTKTVEEVEKAAQNKNIRELEGFGKKTEKNILQGIRFLKKSKERFVLGFEMPEIKKVVSKIEEVEGVQKVTVAGSARRKKETIGDVDILVLAKNNKRVMSFITELPRVDHVHAQGKTKTSVKLKTGIDIDVRIVPKKSYGAALNYFTGSKSHNVRLREIAQDKNWKLNEYGLFNKKEEQIAGKTEKDLYQKLGLEYIEPELRENKGEIEAARKNNLPNLVGYDELKGDLQIQTDWSDGDHSIEEIARKAMKMNLEYLAITDHTQSLAMANGLDEEKIQKQWEEIEKLNKKFKKEGKDFRLLKSTECDILEDGSLDLNNAILKQLDIVGVAIHSHFRLDKKEQTQRIVKAIEHPHSDIFFHPTGRKIQERKAYELDMETVLEAAKENNVILEANAFPNRLDLKDEHIRKAIEKDIKLSISSDAHHKNHLNYLEYGIAQARRGWAESKNIINTKPLEGMMGFIE